MTWASEVERFSANLGFLFTEMALTDAVGAAARAGFAAIECHWPFETDPSALKSACAAANVPLLALNTWPGDRAAGEFGLAALTGREEEARAEIDRALDYALACGAGAVHVMAGRNGDGDVFCEALGYACGRAAKAGLDVLIEPLNCRDAPEYVLPDTRTAMGFQDRVGADNLKIMYDCYHLQIMEGDLLTRASGMLDRIGHIQFAAVPDRGEPDTGEVHYPWLLPALRDAGYTGFFGAEYKPRGGTTAGLGWLNAYR